MNRYRRILRAPRVAPLITAVTLTRVPFAINGLALLLFIREQTGSFGLAGACVGALALGAALGAPFAARLVDRRGRRMLLALALAHGAGAVGLIALGSSGAAALALIGSSALLGATYPPTGAVLRSLWPELLGSEPELVSAAYAFDSVLIEVSFVAGPLITAALVALAGPEAALALSGALVITGTSAFVLLLPVRGTVEPDAGRRGPLGALAAPAVRIVALTSVPVGFCLGTVEIALPAFSHAEGHRELAGVLLAIWSVGSAIGGLLFGARSVRGDLAATYLRIAWIFPLACLPLAAAGSPFAMAAFALLAGLPVAPLIASRNELLAVLAPAGTATEAFTWLTTALVAGLSLGAAVGGALVEADGWPLAVLTGVAIAGLGSALAFRARDALQPRGG